MIRLILLICFCSGSMLTAQLTETQLPIVIINTSGAAIENEPKTFSELGIIYNGPGANNEVSDFPNEYRGYCGIETRGYSALNFEKKSYGIELWDEDQSDITGSFLGFDREEDFILNGPYSDKSLINNTVVLQLAREMGHYASKTRFVELVVNGEYQGVYVLMEKIKRDKNRVDISKLKKDDLSGDELTGGYIFKIDHGKSGGWTSEYEKYSHNEPLYFQYVYPEEADILPKQADYIQNYVASFEEALKAQSYTNDLGKHYTAYIDLRSFVDNFIINEVTKNVDAYWLSSYFHKDKDSQGGRIVAGPVWDYNLSLANANYCQCDNPKGWIYYQCKGHSPFWWDRFFSSYTFTSALNCRWDELRQSILSDDNLLEIIDSKVAELGPAAHRNFERWPILGEGVWPNSKMYEHVQSHEEVIIKMKKWLLARVDWMDKNLPGEAALCDQLNNQDIVIVSATDDYEIKKAAPDLITFAIPFFVLLIMLEVFLSHRMQRENYVLKDATSSIAMGLGSQVIGMGGKLIIIAAFYLAYEYRVFTFGFGVVVWVVAFFLEDLTYYIFHRTSHGSRFFWASHVIHHSSQKYTLATALRQTWTGELTGTFLFWVWMPLLGFHPMMILTLKAVSLIYQFWIHTELITKLPRWFEFVFNTPSHHRVHHSSDVKYLDMNHAGILIIWDRMFGTFIEEKEQPIYGIRENLHSHNLITIAFHEWVAIGKDLRSKTSFFEKLKYVFGPPGWSHDGSRKTTAQLKQELD